VGRGDGRSGRDFRVEPTGARRTGSLQATRAFQQGSRTAIVHFALETVEEEEEKERKSFEVSWSSPAAREELVQRQGEPGSHGMSHLDWWKMTKQVSTKATG